MLYYNCLWIKVSLKQQSSYTEKMIMTTKETRCGVSNKLHISYVTINCHLSETCGETPKKNYRKVKKTSISYDLTEVVENNKIKKILRASNPKQNKIVKVHNLPYR